MSDVKRWWVHPANIEPVVECDCVDHFKVVLASAIGAIAAAGEGEK